MIDARANDRGSSVETIYSLDQDDPTNPQLLDTLPSGAMVQTNGRSEPGSKGRWRGGAATSTRYGVPRVDE